MPVDRRLADDRRLAEPGVQLGLREALRVRAQVEEVERILGADVRRLLQEGAGIGVPVDPRAGAHREVVTTVRADPQRRLQLVVPVVRTALRAGVRMLLLCWGRSVLVLDLDVDPGLGHVGSLDPSSLPAGDKPSAWPRRASACSFRGDARRPVNPAPAGRGIEARSASRASRWIPPGSGMKTSSSPGSITSPSRAT